MNTTTLKFMHPPSHCPYFAKEDRRWGVKIDDRENKGQMKPVSSCLNAHF